AYHTGSGQKIDLVKAARCYRQAARLSHPLAEGFYGVLLALSQGVKSDRAQAEKHCLAAVAYTKAEAAKGSAIAQLLMGHLHQEGLGVEQDDEEAVQWFRKAAEQGNTSAMLSLGQLYAKGKGVPRDEKEAVSWYRKAAEKNLAAAQYHLGWTYAKG